MKSPRPSPCTWRAAGARSNFSNSLGSTSGRLEEWRGLVPDETLKRREGAIRDPLPPGVDCRGGFQPRRESELTPILRELQELQRLLPFADIRMTDDYTFSQTRPDEVDVDSMPQPRKRRRKSGATRMTKRELRVLQDVLSEPGDLEVEKMLEQAQRDFAIFSRAKKRDS